jgi:hypothetical protein
MSLPEYHQAGLHEWHSQQYFPSLSVDTVEDFLGLIRGATKELAAEVGTTEDKLIALYNSAMAAAMPSMTTDVLDRAMKYTYALGMELTAPLAEVGVELGWEAEGPLPGQFTSNITMVPPGLRVSLIDEHMPPIRDQGERGTCVAFATVAVLEYTHHRTHAIHQDLSEQYLYWNIKRTDSYPWEGTWLEFAFPLARRDGVCREELWPYEPDNRPNDLSHGDPPNIQACTSDSSQHAFTRVIRLRDHRRPEAIKDQLRQGRPVAVAIPVFKTWYANPTARLSGNILMPLRSDRFAVGGHAIVLVGFEEDSDAPGGGYFAVRNSWGDRWGTASPLGPGYGTVPYAYIEQFNADSWTGVV